jgi:hypothetical protein
MLRIVHGASLPLGPAATESLYGVALAPTLT